MPGKQMIEFKDPFKSGLMYVTERSPGLDGKILYKFKGPFQEMADIVNRKNKNGRRYTSELWKRVLADADWLEKLKAKRILGELDHPTDEGQIRRTSHIITAADPDFDTGIITGVLELLNHDQGDAALLKALVDQGVELCVSSRGYGEYLEDGCTIDPKSYKLSTWDVVLDPSVSVAKLNQVRESVNKDLPPEKQVKGKFLETGKEEHKIQVPGSKIENNSNKNKEKNMEEINEKVIKMSGELTEAKVNLATATANLQNMKEKLEDKTTAIATQEKAISQLREKVTGMEEEADQAADLLEKISADNKGLKTEKAKLETQLKDYEKLEEEAVAVINMLKKKVEEYEKLGDEAAGLIEQLTKKLKEASTDSPEKPDTDKGAVGKDKAKGEEEAGKSGDSESDQDAGADDESYGEEEEAGKSGDSESDEPVEPKEEDDTAGPADKPKGKADQKGGMADPKETPIKAEKEGDSEDDEKPKKKEEPKSERAQRKLSSDEALDLLEGTLVGKNRVNG